MKADIYAALVDLDAPLHLLAASSRRVVRVAKSDVWHMDPAHPATLSGWRSELRPCGRGVAAAGKVSAVRRTVAMDVAAREDLRFCEPCWQSFDDGGRLASDLARAQQTAHAFDEAMQPGDLLGAAHHAERLASMSRAASMEAQDAAALCGAWVRDTLSLPRSARLAAALSSASAALLVRAVGAPDVHFDARAARSAGLEVSAARSAHGVWRTQVELLQPDRVIEQVVLASYQAAADQLGVAATNGSALVSQLWCWTEQAAVEGAEDPLGPTFALLDTMARKLRSVSGDDPGSWQALAARSQPTVVHLGAQATLVGERVVERVRAALLAAKDSTVTVVPADAASFAAVARTALGLWDRHYASESPLADPVAAWDAATAIVITAT